MFGIANLNCTNLLSVKFYDILHRGVLRLEKEMATHSSILAWEIPWTENPGGLQSMGPQRVGHDLATE